MLVNWVVVTSLRPRDTAPSTISGDHERSAFEQQVAAQQLVGFAVQRLADTIGQEADAGETRHRDHEREGQQMKFAGTKIAQQHSKGEAQL